MSIDIFGLPDTNDNFQVFNSIGTTWQTWIKPRNCKMVYMMVIGGGGGGAGGAAGSGIARTGGGGGGSSAISRGFFSANMLPDTLYIQVGPGGVGGSSGGNGSAGNLSYVSVEPDTTPAYVLLASGAIPASGATAVTAGVAGTVFVQTNYILSYLGVVQLIAGQGGGNGGANTGGNGSQSVGNIITQGGSGGGGSSAANANGTGGGISITGSLIPAAIAGATAGTSNPGTSGIRVLTPSINSLGIRQPFYNSQAAGGGGNGAGTGGAGGNGAYGCGGGGGGAGTIGGAGGNGGDGIVIITAL